jgi:hypothetical protein
MSTETTQGLLPRIDTVLAKYLDAVWLNYHPTLRLELKAALNAPPAGAPDDVCPDCTLGAPNWAERKEGHCPTCNDTGVRPAPKDALREALEKILHDQPHADTCGAVISDSEVYPCSCWQKLVRAALEASRGVTAGSEGVEIVSTETTQGLRERCRTWLSRGHSDHYFSFEQYCKDDRDGMVEELALFVEGVLEAALNAPPTPQGPCSACGDGDTEMKYHTHDAPPAGVPTPTMSRSMQKRLAVQQSAPKDALREALERELEHWEHFASEGWLTESPGPAIYRECAKAIKSILDAARAALEAPRGEK